MRGLGTVTREAFTLLRRDRVFAPAALLALLVALAANAITNFSIEEFQKVLYDVGFFGLQLVGGLVALFWGVKGVTDARQDGALESELAWPVSRATWLLGRYLGLALCLLLLGVVSLALWQGLMLLNGFKPMRPLEVSAFGGLILGWLVLGALGTLLATFVRQSVATFAGVLLWLVGLATALVANTMPPKAPESTVRVVKGLARAWDLNQFNLVDAVTAGTLDPVNLMWRAGYGVLLVFTMITLACLVFTARDSTV